MYFLIYKVIMHIRKDGTRINSGGSLKKDVKMYAEIYRVTTLTRTDGTGIINSKITQ